MISDCGLSMCFPEAKMKLNENVVPKSPIVKILSVLDADVDRLGACSAQALVAYCEIQLLLDPGTTPANECTY